MSKQRSLSVDIAKGIAIIAIVLGHISFSYPNFSLVSPEDLLFRLWHVPIFFILGGFFIKEEELNQPKYWFKKKFSSLYLKLLYFYIPAVLLHNLFIKIGWYSTLSTTSIIKVYAFTDFIKHIILTICLAGREPIVGPMWFVYVLFMALICLSILSWAFCKIVNDSTKRNQLMFVVMLGLTILSGVLSNKYGLTIRRFSNVFTAMFLIYIGWLMNRKFCLKYDNGLICIACAMIGIEVACMLGGVNLNSNSYKDILQLIVASPAILYFIMYVGKKIENSVLGKCLGKIGRESFYIMALHLAGMKVCTIVLKSVMIGRTPPYRT